MATKRGKKNCISLSHIWRLIPQERDGKSMEIPNRESTISSILDSDFPSYKHDGLQTGNSQSRINNIIDFRFGFSLSKTIILTLQLLGYPHWTPRWTHHPGTDFRGITVHELLHILFQTAGGERLRVERRLPVRTEENVVTDLYGGFRDFPKKIHLATWHLNGKIRWWSCPHAMF